MVNRTVKKLKGKVLKFQKSEMNVAEGIVLFRVPKPANSLMGFKSSDTRNHIKKVVHNDRKYKQREKPFFLISLPCSLCILPSIAAP